MGRNRESRTGIAVLAFIVASATAQFNSPADVRGDCTDKTDGIYPTDHCSAYFLECSGGRTTKQNCSTGLWFNPQSLQCDYRDNILACQDKFSCEGREDGEYGEGCSAMFWYCSGGKLKHSLCPNGTLYNVEARKCDFRSNIRACGGTTKTRSSRLTTTTTAESPTTVPAEETTLVPRDSTEVPYGRTYPTYAPRQRISGTVSKTPLAESSAGTACAGKEDGAHSTSSCSGEYVLCWAGTGTVMHCQEGLMFNEKQRGCDYPMKVAGCSETQSAPSVYGAALASETSASTLPIPRQPAAFDCSTLSDGVYGSWCSRQFLQCVAGVAVTKSCTEGLVYNPGKKQCDYKENCVSPPSSTIVVLDGFPTAIPAVTTAQPSTEFDCSSRSDGLYSRGCEVEFYQCVAGKVYVKRCQDGLVFDDVTKGCDYPTICSAPLTSSNSAPVYSRPSTTTTPAAAVPVSFDCSSRVDGAYSEGCVSHFFECTSGVATSFRCQDGLVFDGVAQRCEYPDKCGQPRPLDQDTSVYQKSQPIPSYESTEKKKMETMSLAFDCSAHVDGSYGEGCPHVFFQCVDGIAYSQTCPEGLLFDQKTANCEYPEKCGQQQSAAEVPVVETAKDAQPTLTPSDIDCFYRSNGMYSTGCTRTFVHCVDGMALNGVCPEGLLFDQESRRCEHPDKCGSPSETVASVPVTSAPYKPMSMETPPPILPSKRDEPAGVLIDCTSLSNGLYTSGCTHTFVQCDNGAAYPLECPAGLVFDKRVNRCVWPVECSSEVTVTLPTVTMPSRLSDAPSTVYEMKEKEQMVTDAPLPRVSNDGSVCTGTGRRAMGSCSSGFVQCIGGKMVARRCPGQSLFDEKIGLCVYDLDGCEMDVDEVEVSDQDATVATAVSPQQDAPSGYVSPPVEAVPSYPQQTVYQQYPQNEYQRTQSSTQYQPAYPTGYQTAPTQEYSKGYESVPAQEYPTGYQPSAQNSQYQNGYGYQSAEYSSMPIYSSFGDSLPSHSSLPECDVGSFRRVSACSPSFDICSPTARQWVRRLCGKSHRFDSTANKCRPIFEVRECDEPMSSYVPPPVQSEVPVVYPHPASSFEYGVPLSGREYEEKHVVDPFKGGYQSGMMESNPFVAVGNTGSFYTDDGLRWVGSARSEGGVRRRGGRRHYKKNGHHSGDYVIVSGNPFGAGRDRVVNDEWKGRKRYDGPVRSSLTAARGHGVRNVVDEFKGRVSHDAPLGVVNPFAVKRADGHRRRGRKSCRRDKHRTRDDWEEDCEEMKEKERPTEGPVADFDRDEEERSMEMEENEMTESFEESADENGNPVESEANEVESESNGETEEREADPELTPEGMDEKIEENEGGEEEKMEMTTSEREEDDDEMEEENEDGSMEGVENDDGEKVERSENESGQSGSAVEEVIEEGVDKEMEEDMESESTEESKTDDVESPDETEETEMEGEVKEDEEIAEETDAGKESMEEEEETTEREDGEKVEESEEMSENEEKEEETPVDDEGKSENGEDTGEVKEEEDVEKEEASETAAHPEESAEEEIEEEPEMEDAEETREDAMEREEKTGKEDLKEETEETEETENGEEEEGKEDDGMNEVEKEETVERATKNGGPFEETDDGEDEKEDGSMEGVENAHGEKNEGGDAETAVEEAIEEGVDKETEEHDESESGDESKADDVELPESIDKPEGNVENGEEEEGKDEESPEAIEGPEEIEEDGEKKETAAQSDEMKEEETRESNGDAIEEEDEDGEVEKEESSDAASQPEEIEEEPEMEDGKEKDEEIAEETDDGKEDSMEEMEETEQGEEDDSIPKMIPKEGKNQGGRVELTYDPDEKKTGVTENGEERTEAQFENGEEDEEAEGDSGEVKGEDVDPEELPDSIENPTRSRRSVMYTASTSTQSPIGRRLSLPRSSRLHRSRFSRLCASSTAGQAISIGQCRQDFVYCKSARRPVVAACPVGDLFDAVMATCVPTDICGAEKTKDEIPSVPLSSLPSRDSSYQREGIRPTMPSPTTISLDQTEKTDCSSFPDGAFPISACSAHYFVCSASVRQEYSCPEGTVYYKETDRCEWPAAVPACAPTAADSPSVSMDKESYSGEGLATTAPTTLSPMHVHFECSKNGGFALDCKGGFVMCSNGFASFMKCPPALVFEEATQSCQYPAQVGSCGLMADSPLAAPSMESSWYTPTTTAAPAKPVEVLVNTPVDKNVCLGVASGLEGTTRDCPSSFVICKEGAVSAVMNCPEGTFFDEKGKKCDYREVACAGGWSGEAHGVESRVELDASPVVMSEWKEYGRRASRPYRPAMPVNVEKIEEEKKEVKRDEEKPVVVPSTVEPVKGATCDWKGAAPSGVCSSQFITCSNGRPQVFDCAAGLVFTPSTSACEYPEFVGGCSQMKESASSSPPSPSPSSSPYSSTLPPSTVSPYLPSLPPSTSSPSSTASPFSHSLVMDESLVEYHRDETPSTTTERPLFPPARNGDHTSAKFEATGDHCTFTADRPSFPLNFCSMTYAVCTHKGLAFKTNCTFGYLFDSVIRRCVPSEHCGQSYLKEIANSSPTSSPLHSATPWSGDSRCQGVTDGTLKPTGLCSGQYIRCEKEAVILETCSDAASVFSPLTGRCVLRVQMAECSASPRGVAPAITRPKMVTGAPSLDVSPSSYPTDLPLPSQRGARIRGGLSSPSSSTQFDARSFCTTKHTDGLYRNPQNCAGIVQCFGGEAFSYPSCAPGLFFNEVDGQCDYASNVPECASQVDPVALDDWASCKGQPHGAYLADDSSCSIYYRCVWGSLEGMSCPDGTAFNPRLSVCDYPSEVPHCQKQ